MTEHYYSEKPNTKHNEKIITTDFFGQKFTFKTDSGVFSKNRVDFGTLLLINSFRLRNKKAKVLDLGCGYGPVGISLSSQITNGQVLLADINERAVGLTRQNVELNQKFIKNEVKISAIQSNGFAGIDDNDFDYILLNPPIRAGKTVIYQLFEDSYNHLKQEGELWIVIQKKQGALSAINKLESIFSNVDIVDKEKGYFILKSTKNIKIKT